MGRLTRIALLALALAAVMGGLIGTSTEAAAGNGYEQWTGGYTDGCYYYWDGYDYSAVACPRSDGGYDFYFAGYGQWAYSFSAGFLNNGGLWLYVSGQYYFDSIDQGVTQGPLLYPTTAFVGPATWDGLTGNPIIDQIVLDSNNAIIDNILAPTCIEVVGNTCYY